MTPEESAAEIVSRALQRSVADSSGLLARLPVAVCCCDASGLLVQYNERAAGLWGQAPELRDPAHRYTGAYKVFLANGDPLDRADSPMARCLRDGAPVRNAELTYTQPDGGRVAVLCNVDPLLDENGRVVGGVNCIQDISSVRGAQQRASRRTQTFRVFIDALPAAIYTTDAEGRITFFNKSAAELWGREPTLNETRWCGAYKLETPDGKPAPFEESAVARALKTGQPVHGVETIVVRPDGTRTPCLPYPTPIHDEAGVLQGAVNMLVDISERKESEARLRIMIDELNHRVKNSLATVQAIASQTFRDAEAPRPEVDAFLSRLFALSKAHDHLTQEHWAAADLHAIVTDVLAPLSDRARDRIEIEAPRLRVRPRMALTLGMALNELATNAMKYGAMSAETGQLSVRCEVRDAALHMAWRESGGPAVTAPTRRGFGTRMIERGIAAELNGKADIRFAPSGLECDIDVPLTGLS